MMRRRGSATLELALATTILVPVFAGVFQYGYSLYIYNTLDSAARGGARYASLRTYDSATATPSAAYSAAVKNMVVYGNPQGSGKPVAPGLSVASVEVTPHMHGAAPESVTVRINGYKTDAVFTSFTWNGKPSVTFPYSGIAAP